MNYDEEKKPKKIRVTGRTHRSHQAYDSEVTVGHLSEEEADDIEAFTLGACWIRISDEGRVERVERFTELPPASEDPHRPPKWIPLVDWTKEAPFLCNQVPSLPEEPKPEHYCPSIIIHGLCGYNNTPYEYEARKLQAFGFECLRSRCGRDGKFWELWYLPSVWSAKGELKEAIESQKSEKDKIDTAIKLLCKQVSFGAVDVCYQRAAMAID